MLNSQVVVELFKKHYGDLRNILSAKFPRNTSDAEDIIQDAFHNILRVEQMDDIENPKAYLYKTATNLALDRIRRQGRHNDYLAMQDSEVADEKSPERSVLAAGDLQRLESALEQLPEKYRKTFLLSRVESKSYKQISAQLGIPQSTVEKHIIKTLKYLRDHVDTEV